MQRITILRYFNLLHLNFQHKWEPFIFGSFFFFVWIHFDVHQTICTNLTITQITEERGSTLLNHTTGLMPNFFWYPVQINDAMSFTDKCLNFRPTKGPLKQKLASVQSANGINLLPLLRAARYFQGLISTGIFWAADVPLHPAHHQECLGDRGAAHQNTIRTLLATRWTHAQNASCGGRSVPFNSSSFLPLHTAVSLCPPNAPSLKQTEQSIQFSFFFCLFVLTKQRSKRWVSTSGWLSMNSMRDSGRRRCGHVNKSISGALDRWDL